MIPNVLLFYFLLLLTIVIAVLVVVIFARVKRIKCCLKMLVTKRGSEGEIPEDGESEKELCPLVHTEYVFEECSDMIQKFLSLIKDEKLLMDPKLTIQKVADILRVDKRELSKAINAELNSNFNAIVNKERIRLFAKEFSNNPEQDITMLYGSLGFTNENTFRNAFSREMSMTPVLWCKKIRTEFRKTKNWPPSL